MVAATRSRDMIRFTLPLRVPVKVLVLLFLIIGLFSTVVNARNWSQDEIDTTARRIRGLALQSRSGIQAQLDSYLQSILPQEDESEGGILLSNRLALFTLKSRQHGYELYQVYFFNCHGGCFTMRFRHTGMGTAAILYLRYTLDNSGKKAVLEDIFYGTGEQASEKLEKFFRYR